MSDWVYVTLKTSYKVLKTQKFKFRPSLSVFEENN